MTDKLNFAVTDQHGARILSEGLCGHCLSYCVFKQLKPPGVTRALFEGWADDDEHRIVTEEFLFGVCPRPTCRQATVVRRVWTSVTWHGDPREGPPSTLEVIFPRARSARALPSEEVPKELRKRYEEAASIEFLSPTSAAFMAGRLVDQAIRHRMVAMKRSLRRVRKSTLADLITTFVEAEKGNPDLREMLTTIKNFRNFVAHPPFADLSLESEIDQAEASFLLDCCLELLEFVYARPAKIRAMTERLRSKLHSPAAGTPITLGPVAPASEQLDFVASDDEVPF